jgi:GAF domain-containing protein
LGELARDFDDMAHKSMTRDRRLSLFRVLIPSGMAMSAEKDFNRLLETIVDEAQKITFADAGTLYLRTEDDKLRFVIVRNTSLGIALGGTADQEVSFPLLSLYDENGNPNHTQVATYVALMNKPIAVEDAYNTRAFDFSGTKSFDERTGYRSKSFLALPLVDGDGQVTGVLQLINSRDPYTGEYVAFEMDEVISALGLMASAALAGFKREESLRQEISKLRIEVDLVKQAKQVSEITESDYFQQLQVKAQKLRENRK